MKQPSLFHNTSNLAGLELEQAQERSQSQTKAVLAFFQKFPGVLFQPSEVHKKTVNLKLINWRTPIQSIRRALSDLTKKGDLIKTKRQKPGEYGSKHPEYCWTLNQRPE